MKTNASISGALLLMFILWQGCSEDPNNVGSSLVAPQDTLRLGSIVIPASFDSTFLTRVSGTGSVLTGIAHGIQAWSLVQFTGFSRIPPSSLIDSAVLTIPLNYRFLDSSGILGFFVHQMQRPWSQSTFQWDSLSIAGAYAPSADTSVLFRIAPSDTAIILRIDGLVNKWVKDTLNSPNGIVLIPDSIQTSMIGGERATAGVVTQPLLTVSYRDSVDTVHTYSTRSTQAMFVANGAVGSSSSRFAVQAGIGYRGVLRFDSLAIPRNASITQATLELAVLSDSSFFNGFTRDTITASLLRISSYPYDSLVLSTVCSPGFVGNQKVYLGDLRTMVQLWITSKEPNDGIVLRPLGEYTTFDRFSFAGVQAAAALRPKLTITYTLLP